MYIDKFIFKDLLEKPPASPVEQVIEEEAAALPHQEEPALEISQEIAVTISKDELESSFAQGYEKAKAELESKYQDQEQQIIEILNKINMQLALEIADQQKLFAEFKQLAIPVAIKAADKVIGEVSEANEEKIINFITKYINLLAQELSVTITLHPKTISLINAKVEALIADNMLKEKFIMQADEHLPKTDCVIKWKNAEAAYNMQDLWQRIQAALGQ
jgi:flagellar biosynthesis/type III secretory pathway protein FliH